MKKLISFVLSVLLVFSFNLMIFADNEKTVVNITFEDAVERMESNNIEIRLIDKKIEIASKQYSESLDRAEEAKGKMHPEESGIVKLRKDEFINWKKKQLELKNLKNERLDKVESLSMELQNSYFNTLMLKQDINNIDTEIINFDKNIQQMNLKVKAGQLKEEDVKSAQVQRSQLLGQKNTMLRQYESALTSVKKMLGFKISDTVNLTAQNLRLEIFNDQDIAERIIKAAEADYSLQSKTEELTLLKEELKIVEDYSNRRMPDEVESLKNSINEKNLRLEDTKITIEASLWNEYFSLKNSEDTIQIEKLNMETASIKLKAAETNAKLGKLSDLALSNARLEFKKQESRLQREINQYMLQVKSYQQELNQ